MMARGTSQVSGATTAVKWATMLGTVLKRTRDASYVAKEVTSPATALKSKKVAQMSLTTVKLDNRVASFAIVTTIRTRADQEIPGVADLA